MAAGVRVILADNPGPFTVHGTRTHVIGTDPAAVIDPGPRLEDHVRAILGALEGATRVTVLLTHGHVDHAGALEDLADALEARGMSASIRGAGHPLAIPLEEGETVATDVGPLAAVRTPGHTSDHLAFHWPAAAGLFAGDLLLGRGSTTWVGEYPGCVADYLASLDRLRALDLAVIFPGHGPALDDPADAIARFAAHRLKRIDQVRRALRSRAEITSEELMTEVYGDSVGGLVRQAALKSLEALREYALAHPEA